jgi:restriction system protein
MPRKKSSLIEDLANILPWWVLVILAAISCFAIKYLLPPEFLAPQDANPLSTLFSSARELILSMISFIVMAIFLIAANLSAVNAWKKRKLLDRQENLDTIKNISWKEFEELVGEAYRRKGYAVTECGGGGADGGIDLVLKKGREKILVQYKHWKLQKIGVKIIRELYGIIHADGATGGIVITSGSFTQEAEDFAKGKPLELIDGTNLLILIKEVQKKQSGPVKVNEQSTFCPNCGAPMVLRSAKKGLHRGEYFWGCSAFPKCRSIRHFKQ